MATIGAFRYEMAVQTSSWSGTFRRSGMEEEDEIAYLLCLPLSLSRRYRHRRYAVVAAVCCCLCRLVLLLWFAAVSVDLTLSI
jgi:hypothetical protein